MSATALSDGTYRRRPAEAGWRPAEVGPVLVPEGAAVAIDDDGGVTIKPAAPVRSGSAGEFDENLAERIEDGEAAAFVQDVIDGIDADIASRQGWVSNYTKALDLLGLKIEDVSATKAQKRNVSRLNHPLLLEAVVKAQGLARAELLPAAGPVKVRLRNSDTAGLDDLALALEQDMNAYLTVGAPEYVPEMDRGLFGVFFSGNLFKKVYFDPLKRRPVSAVVSVDDLIVSQEAADLDTAIRVTHRSELSPAMMRRMQVFGDWLDVSLSPPAPMMGSEIKVKTDSITGIQPSGMRQQDQSFTVYECTTDWDLADLGIDEPGVPEGLPVPVVATIERDSRRLLSLRRGWREGDPMFRRRQRFVHYGMVPALDFLCLGYLHLLGNQTKALTAAWRLVCDAGMFSNFPGGVKIKGARMSTNEIAPAPGEFVDVDGNGVDDIRKVLMAMPYKEASQVFIAFMQLVESGAEKLAGTVQVESGEGRTNIPVGTMMAMVEQSTQLSAVVHKRLHTAQAREFQLLKECVAENPESICAVIPNPEQRWVGKIGFDSVDLVPASDPNVPSQVHRVMLATAMVEMAAQNPDIYNKFAAHQRAWKIVGLADTNDFLQPQPPPPGAGAPNPAQAVAAQAQQTKAQADLLNAQTKMQDTHRKAAAEAVQSDQEARSQVQDNAAKQQQQATQVQLAEIQAETERLRLQAEMAKAAQAQQSAAMATQNAGG